MTASLDEHARIAEPPLAPTKILRSLESISRNSQTVLSPRAVAAESLSFRPRKLKDGVLP